MREEKANVNSEPVNSLWIAVESSGWLRTYQCNGQGRKKLGLSFRVSRVV